MADLADYEEILASRGLKEEDVVPLVGGASEELEERILPALREAYAQTIAGDPRVKDPEAFLEKRLAFARRAFYANANELLRRKLKGLLRDLGRVGIDAPADLVAGVHPWESFNAFCCPARESGYLILLYNRFLKTVEAAGSVFLAPIEAKQKQDLLVEVVTCPADRDPMEFVRGIHGGTNHSLWILVEFADAAQDFVLLHEIAHAVYGHPGHAVPAADDEEEHRGEIRNQNSHAQELLADAWAAQALPRLAELDRETHAAFSRAWERDAPYSSADVLRSGAAFVLGIQLIREAVTPVRYKSPSHPPAAARLEALPEGLVSTSPGSDFLELAISSMGG